MSRVTNYSKPHVPERHHDLALDVSQMTGCSGQLITLPCLGPFGQMSLKTELNKCANFHDERMDVER